MSKYGLVIFLFFPALTFSAEKAIEKPSSGPLMQNIIQTESKYLSVLKNSNLEQLELGMQLEAFIALLKESQQKYTKTNLTYNIKPLDIKKRTASAKKISVQIESDKVREVTIFYNDNTKHSKYIFISEGAEEIDNADVSDDDIY